MASTWLKYYLLLRKVKSGHLSVKINKLTKLTNMNKIDVQKIHCYKMPNRSKSFSRIKLMLHEDLRASKVGLKCILGSSFSFRIWHGLLGGGKVLK